MREISGGASAPREAEADQRDAEDGESGGFWHSSAEFNFRDVVCVSKSIAAYKADRTKCHSAGEAEEVERVRVMGRVRRAHRHGERWNAHGDVEGQIVVGEYPNRRDRTRKRDGKTFGTEKEVTLT